jgi:putative transposase
VPYRKVEFRTGQTYHLYNRGVNRQPIFFCAENWVYFIKRLRHYFQPELVDILAYCLMPTHYHLMIHLKTDDLSARVMQPLGVSYTKAINRQQGRVGPLFPCGATVPRGLFKRHGWMRTVTCCTCLAIST